MTIPQPKIASNNAMEKSVIVILQLKFASNNAFKESLVDLSIKNQLDSPAKTFTGGQDANI